MPVVICVVSRARQEGKTSLIVKLAERLTCEGFKVATVKHIHGSFDTTEKDTWRHLEAGATITVASTPTEVVAIKKEMNPSLEDVLEAIYIDSDLVLVEGYKRSPYPKILCVNTASDALSAVKDIPNVVMVSGSIVSKMEEIERLRAEFPNIGVYDVEEMVSCIKKMLIKEILRGLPGLDCGHCGYDLCLGLAKAIMSQAATKKDCEVLSTNIATVRIDDRFIPLGKFPQEALRGVISGFLSSLKGVEKQTKHIEISIRSQDEAKIK